MENSEYRKGSATTISLENNKRSQTETKSILGISRTAGEGNLLDLLADGVEWKGPVERRSAHVDDAVCSGVCIHFDVGLSTMQRARLPGRGAKWTFFKRTRNLANEETNASETTAKLGFMSAAKRTDPGDGAFAWGGGWLSCAQIVLMSVSVQESTTRINV